jgi:hypothetical protein
MSKQLPCQSRNFPRRAWHPGARPRVANAPSVASSNPPNSRDACCPKLPPHPPPTCRALAIALIRIASAPRSYSYPTSSFVHTRDSDPRCLVSRAHLLRNRPTRKIRNIQWLTHAAALSEHGFSDSEDVPAQPIAKGKGKQSVREDSVKDEDEDDSEVGEDEYAHLHVHMDRTALTMRQIRR